MLFYDQIMFVTTFALIDPLKNFIDENFSQMLNFQKTFSF